MQLNAAYVLWQTMLILENKDYKTSHTDQVIEDPA